MTGLPAAAGAPATASAFELVPRAFWHTLLFSRKYRDHQADAPAIIAHLYDLRSQETKPIASDVAPRMKSATGLFESRLDLFEKTEHPALKRLVAFIESSVRRAVHQANGGTIDSKRIRVEFKDSWFHITNDGGFHDAHIHSGCSWCGIFYLQISDVPANPSEHAPNGVNRFYSPLNAGGSVDDFGNLYLKNNFLDVPPTEGTLILFPSYLLHSALAYRGQRDRVILSFNSTAHLNPG